MTLGKIPRGIRPGDYLDVYKDGSPGLGDCRESQDTENFPYLQ